MSAEMMDELRAIIREEMSAKQSKPARHVWNRILKEYDDLFASFDYKTNESRRMDGAVFFREYERDVEMRFKVTNALSAILRAIYRVEQIGHLPEDQEEHILELSGKILRLMREESDAFLARRES